MLPILRQRLERLAAPRWGSIQEALRHADALLDSRAAAATTAVAVARDADAGGAVAVTPKPPPPALHEGNKHDADHDDDDDDDDEREDDILFRRKTQRATRRVLIDSEDDDDDDDGGADGVKNDDDADETETPEAFAVDPLVAAFTNLAVAPAACSPVTEAVALTAVSSGCEEEDDDDSIGSGSEYQDAVTKADTMRFTPRSASAPAPAHSHIAAAVASPAQSPNDSEDDTLQPVVFRRRRAGRQVLLMDDDDDDDDDDSSGGERVSGGSHDDDTRVKKTPSRRVFLHEEEEDDDEENEENTSPQAAQRVPSTIDLTLLLQSSDDDDSHATRGGISDDDVLLVHDPFALDLSPPPLAPLEDRTATDKNITPRRRRSRTNKKPSSSSSSTLDATAKKNVTPAKWKAGREDLARRMFEEFNTTVFGSRLPADMVIKWSTRLLRTAGMTYMSTIRVDGVRQRAARVELAAKVLTDETRLRKTLLHELCHVAAWTIDGVRKPPHGPVFQKWGARCTRAYPDVGAITTCHNYKIQYRFLYACLDDACGWQMGRHSKSIDTDKMGCGRCRGRIHLVGEFAPDGTPRKKRAQTAYSRFQKVQHLRLKESGLSFTERNKEISKLWKLEKKKRACGNDQ